MKATAARKPRPRRRQALSDYWDATREPLYCLVFLLPLVVTYEFTAAVLRVAAWPERRLVAQRLIGGALSAFGASGAWLPGVALLLTLAVWHVLTRRSWHIRAWVPLTMVAESAALTPPLLAITLLPLAAAGAAEAPPRLAEQLVVALGAGIYEEMIFRLALISALLILLDDILRVPRPWAAAAAGAVAALLFAACHYHPIGVDAFAWGSFVERALAGGYLSLIYLTRGLGVAIGCHVAYNLTAAALDV